MRCPLQCNLPLKQVSVTECKSHPSDRDSVKTFCEKNGLKWPLCEEVVYLMAGAQEQHTHFCMQGVGCVGDCLKLVFSELGWGYTVKTWILWCAQ